MTTSTYRGTATFGPWRVRLYSLPLLAELDGSIWLTDTRTLAHYYANITAGWRWNSADLGPVPKTAIKAVERASRDLTGSSLGVSSQ